MEYKPWMHRRRNAADMRIFLHNRNNFPSVFMKDSPISFKFWRKSSSLPLNYEKFAKIGSKLSLVSFCFFAIFNQFYSIKICPPPRKKLDLCNKDFFMLSHMLT